MSTENGRLGMRIFARIANVMPEIELANRVMQVFAFVEAWVFGDKK